MSHERPAARENSDSQTVFCTIFALKLFFAFVMLLPIKNFKYHIDMILIKKYTHNNFYCNFGDRYIS